MTDKIPRLIEPQELESLLYDERLIIIDLSSLSLYSLQHVPGSVHLPYSALMSNSPQQWVNVRPLVRSNR